MKKGSTIFLRAVVCIFGLIVLALCIFVLPTGLRTDATGMYRPILIGMYITAVPFFMALYQILKLLNLIDRGQAFSSGAIAALKIIRYCAASISAIYAVGLPYIFYAADQDDAPGVVLIGLIFTLGPLAIAVFAAVLQKLFSGAILIKSENDQTV